MAESEIQDTPATAEQTYFWARNEIEYLRSENDRLREILRGYVDDSMDEQRAQDRASAESAESAEFVRRNG